MKKISVLVIAAMILFSISSFAAGAKFTGADYLKLSKPQRVSVVKSFKDNVKRQGVTLKKDPVFYCQRLDEFYVKNPALQKEGFNKVMQTIAIMEYDWNQRGVDKDALARNWLGEKTYQANKARLGKK